LQPAESDNTEGSGDGDFGDDDEDGRVDDDDSYDDDDYVEGSGDYDDEDYDDDYREPDKDTTSRDSGNTGWGQQGSTNDNGRSSFPPEDDDVYYTEGESEVPRNAQAPAPPRDPVNGNGVVNYPEDVDRRRNRSGASSFFARPGTLAGKKPLSPNSYAAVANGPFFLLFQPWWAVPWWASCAPSSASCSSCTACARRTRAPTPWTSPNGRPR